MNRYIIAGLLGLGLGRSAQSQVFKTADLNLAVPDGNSAGLVSTIHVHGIAANPFGVEVHLTLRGLGEGGYAGDLYVTLQHHSGFSVLLNRPGSIAGRPGGYADGAGMDLVFSDQASADIHDYRLTLSGSHTVPLPGVLTGMWQPDGRNVDPGSEVWGATRTAMLDAFSGIDPNGDWNLFVADLSGGGEFELNSWAMQITPVPESETFAFAGGLSLLVWATGRRGIRSVLKLLGQRWQS